MASHGQGRVQGDKNKGIVSVPLAQTAYTAELFAAPSRKEGMGWFFYRGSRRLPPPGLIALPTPLKVSFLATKCGTHLALIHVLDHGDEVIPPGELVLLKDAMTRYFQMPCSFINSTVEEDHHDGSPNDLTPVGEESSASEGEKGAGC